VETEVAAFYGPQSPPFWHGGAEAPHNCLHWRNAMLKLLTLSLVGIGLAATPVLAQTKDAPKTKAECAKMKDMKWDGKACLKK
jgi:hypothetical protein